MPLRLALLLSLCFHALLIAAPSWLTIRPPAKPPAIEVRLLPPAEPVAMAEAVSTEATSATPAPAPPPINAPRRLEGRALHRAQAALSKHLFYPPDAVARGIEGEVILLLTLSASGQIESAEIARGSGHALLDQAALDAARHIGALPGNPRQILFPLGFRLQ